MSTDTRHPQYNDATIQAAFEEACNSIAKEYPKLGKLLTLAHYNGSVWTEDSPARLDLAKAFLARLPEPTPPVVDGKTPGQVALFILNPHGDWAKLLAGDKALYEAAASAVIAAFGGARLRPIAEAGPVPAGAVRVTARVTADGYIINPTRNESVTHFADIILPDASQHLPIATLAQDQVQATPEMQAAEQAAKPERAQPWQPAVGEPVRLVSGGPAMTVIAWDDEFKVWDCGWFVQYEYCTDSWPSACLKPAKEGQP